MRLLLRSHDTAPGVWRDWEASIAEFFCYYTATAWRDRMGGGTVEERMRLMPGKSRKERRKTPITPGDFYVDSGPIGGNIPFAPVGSFGSDYSPLGEAFRKEQDLLTDQLVKEPVVLDADLVGCGFESAHEHHGQISQDRPILHHQWRGSVGPTSTVGRYLKDCAESFSWVSIVEAVNNGGHLIIDDGKYHLARATFRRL